MVYFIWYSNEPFQWSRHVIIKFISVVLKTLFVGGLFKWDLWFFFFKDLVIVGDWKYEGICRLDLKRWRIANIHYYYRTTFKLSLLYFQKEEFFFYGRTIRMMEIEKLYKICTLNKDIGTMAFPNEVYCETDRSEDGGRRWQLIYL